MSAALTLTGQFSSWIRPHEVSTEEAGGPASGHHPTFAVVHRRIEKTVLRAVHRRLAEHEDRDNVVQEVLLQVFVRLKSLRDPDCLEMWTARIAFNMVNAHIRRRRRGRIVYGPNPPSNVLHEDDSTGRVLASRTLDVIDRLPENERELLCRSWFTQTKWAELADESACSVATIKRRFRRARTRFKRLARKDADLRALLETSDDALPRAL